MSVRRRRPHFHDKCSWRWVIAAPVHENAVAVSGGWGMVGATPEDRPVVAGSGAPDLFGEAENELMCWAS